MSGTSISTGLLTANTQVLTGRGILSQMTALGDGTNVATVSVYDGTDNTGPLLARAVCAVGEQTVSAGINVSVRAETGLYVEVTGTGAGAVIHHGAV